MTSDAPVYDGGMVTSRAYASRGLSVRERIALYGAPQSDGCILWTGTVRKDSGYAVGSYAGRRNVRWHVLAWEDAHGPVPDGMVLDHACHSRDRTCPGGPCRHRSCVNPDHLEPVPQLENLARGRGVNRRDKDRCAHGHLYDGTAPIKGGRYQRRTCSTCSARRTAAWRSRQRE